MAKLPYAGPSLDRLLGSQGRARPVSAKAKKASREETAHSVLPLLQKGIALQMKGSLGLAAELYQAVLAKHPNHPDALHLMGTIAIAGGELDAAIGMLERAVAGKPADAAIRCNLANALLQNDQAATAEFHLRRALKLKPDFSAARCFLADCRAIAGDRNEAKEIYEEVLASVPSDPQALIGYGDLCVTLGDIPMAQSLYRRALALGTVSALALAGLATCERPAKDSPEAAEILNTLRKPGLRPIEYVNLNYAAGNIAAAASDYDQAFAHFSDAKRLSADRFDIAALKDVFATLRRVFTKPFFEAHAKFGDPSKRPIFLVGMPRSGTTLAEQIISRLPDVAAGDELGDMGRIAASLGLRTNSAKEFAKRVTKLSPRETKELAARYLSTLDTISATAPRVTDKMPHNFQLLGLIALLFPNAKIIHCRRDPLDTCVSCFTTQLKGHLHGYRADLGTLGSYYREYDALMRHWREVLPLPIHELQYERLIDAPEDESRKLVEFVGLPWDPACLTPHESARPVRTQSRMQVRQPIYRTSIGRWRRYETHLGPLKAALGDLADSAGEGVSTS